jgi:meso-butanediol dehydrogenase/(S,S)-butanediol dehydrogenase/diacetyl reductase
VRGLTDKRVLVTGGAGGIGIATAARFLEEGSRVVILDLDTDALDKASSELEGLAGTIEADVADPVSVDRAFEALRQLAGGLDILINNAGISIRHPFGEITAEQWRKVIDVNLNGVFFVAHRAARLMLESGGGVIINMGSTNALAGYHYYADYNASKAGVLELTRSMALELAPLIRVNAVCPGFILTPMQDAEYSEAMKDAFSSKLPLGRLGAPEDVAALFAFLASEEASFITGQHFVIDGGEIAGGLASQP